MAITGETAHHIEMTGGGSLVFHIKERSQLPVLDLTVYDAANSPVSLGDIAVMLTINPKSLTGKTLFMTKENQSLTPGRVTRKFEPDDLVEGIYDAEIKLILADMTVIKLPNEGYLKIRVWGSIR